VRSLLVRKNAHAVVSLLKHPIERSQADAVAIKYLLWTVVAICWMPEPPQFALPGMM